MPRRALPSKLHRLTVREVQTAGDGEHADGGGLLLRVQGAASMWVLRFTSPTGKRREMGLGAAERNNATVAGRSLAAARDAAYKARALLAQGIDPIDHRKAQQRATRQAAEAAKADARRDALTLARAARAYHERVIEPNRTTKHAADWINSLEQHIPAALWHKPVADIEAPELLDCIVTLHAAIPETATRIRQRLEAVFEDCIFRKQCSGNPAASIRRKLREMRKGRETESYAALPFKEVPQFMRELRAREGVAARALEFTILSAARTGEVIGATWDEFDLDAGVWTVPAARMKGGEKHVVHLSARAVEIVEAMRLWQQPYVFPGPRLDGRPLSNMAMLTLLRRMDADKRTTVHGLCRATFSTWAHETGAARPDVIEACLAHREADRVKAAYNRAQFMAERKALLAAWADYLDGEAPAANVIEFPQARVVGA